MTVGGGAGARGLALAAALVALAAGCASAPPVAPLPELERADPVVSSEAKAVRIADPGAIAFASEAGDVYVVQRPPDTAAAPESPYPTWPLLVRRDERLEPTGLDLPLSFWLRGARFDPRGRGRLDAVGGDERGADALVVWTYEPGAGRATRIATLPGIGGSHVAAVALPSGDALVHIWDGGEVERIGIARGDDLRVIWTLKPTVRALPPQIAVSRDGTRAAIRAKAEVHLLSMPDGAARRIFWGWLAPAEPLISPDGAWVAVLVDRAIAGASLVLVPAGSGPMRFFPTVRGAAPGLAFQDTLVWLDDRTIAVRGLHEIHLADVEGRTARIPLGDEAEWRLARAAPGRLVLWGPREGAWLLDIRPALAKLAAARPAPPPWGGETDLRTPEAAFRSYTRAAREGDVAACSQILGVDVAKRLTQAGIPPAEHAAALRSSVFDRDAATLKVAEKSGDRAVLRLTWPLDKEAELTGSYVLVRRDGRWFPEGP